MFVDFKLMMYRATGSAALALENEAIYIGADLAGLEVGPDCAAISLAYLLQRQLRVVRGQLGDAPLHQKMSWLCKIWLFECWLLEIWLGNTAGRTIKGKLIFASSEHELLALSSKLQTAKY